MLFLAGLYVHLLDKAGRGHHCPAAHQPDHWLAQAQPLHTAHLESVDVVPEIKLFLLPMNVLDAADIKGAPVREH